MFRPSGGEWVPLRLADWGYQDQIQRVGGDGTQWRDNRQLGWCGRGEDDRRSSGMVARLWARTMGEKVAATRRHLPRVTWILSVLLCLSFGLLWQRSTRVSDALMIHCSGTVYAVSTCPHGVNLGVTNDWLPRGVEGVG